MIELCQAKGDLSPEIVACMKGAAGLLYVGMFHSCAPSVIAIDMILYLCISGNRYSTFLETRCIIHIS